MSNRRKSYHFVGIGGSGMNALAQIMVGQGAFVSGSDRNYDRKINPELFDKLAAQGILLFTQDGSGLQRPVDCIVVSTAIEEDNPDITIARQKKIPIIHRAELLAQIANSSKCIAVAGTSGKTTVVGMIGYILYRAGKSPTIINGGIIKNFCQGNQVGNAFTGSSDLCVVETDESDGSIIRFNPEIGVITNISLDHKPLKELKSLFERFAAQVKGTLILNQDCEQTSLLKARAKTITFGQKSKADVAAENLDVKAEGLLPGATSFEVGGIGYQLNLAGAHNVSNALAAIAVAKALGIDDLDISAAIGEFTGIKRRLELVGKAGGVKIFDDYGHNPDKIKATLQTLKPQFSKLFVVFQPHGFGPTRLLKQELIEVLSRCLRKQDVLYMPEIYYAGGTVVQDISSADLVLGIKKKRKQAFYTPDRLEIIKSIAENARPDNGIVVMGARDDSLPEFCLKIKNAIKLGVGKHPG